MRSHAASQSERGVFKRVAPGLYRYSITGVYFAHLRIGGKLFRESLQATDRKMADRKLADFRRDKSRVDASLGKSTLSDLCWRYSATLAHFSPSSQKAKRGALQRLARDWPEGAEQQVSKINPSHCETWLARQAQRMGRSHYNAYIQLLRDVLEFAVRDRIIPENPAGHLKYLKRERPIRQTPSWQEFQAIVADIRQQPFNADAKESGDFVEFIGLAGLGQAQASALTLADIDFDRGQIITFRHKTRQGFSIPIYPQLRSLVERLVAEAKQEGRARLLCIKDAKKAIFGACKRLGLPNYTHRSFRRMFIVRAIEKGIDVKVIAEFQGHRDGGKLILDTYSHVNRVHAQRMAQLMTSDDDTTLPGNVVPMKGEAA